MFLLLETSTEICSVGLSHNGTLIALEESESNSHASDAIVFIEKLCKSTNIALADIDAVAVSQGPGSYTGLRIGVSTAKGLCYALHKPLIAISTLQAMAYQAAIEHIDKDMLFCPMIDARRMEVYAAVYNHNNNLIRAIQADVVELSIYEEYLKDHKVLFCGNGAHKCKEILSANIHAVFDDRIAASAKNMIYLTEQAFKNRNFEDIAYLEPFYLKDFIAGKPNVKGLK